MNDVEAVAREIRLSEPAFGEEEWRALREPLISGWVAQGPKVVAFEAAFARRHASVHAAAASSCTTALHLIFASMGVGPGDEVIVPAFTWVSTANAVRYCGATPVLADIDPRTFNVAPAEIARRLSSRTRAVIVVHLFGLCADMDGVRAAVGDLPIIEDAACAAGAAYRDTPAGSLGNAAAFSFHPRKSITTGEGGMVTTDDSALDVRVRALRNHGATTPAEWRDAAAPPHVMGDFDVIGFNYRMTDLQAAIGLVQLEKLDALIDARAAMAQTYCAALTEVEWLDLPQAPQDGRHAWQSFVVRVDPTKAPFPRNEIMMKLRDAGIATRPGTHAIHRLGAYRSLFGFRDDDYPGALDADQNSMAIPLHNKMSDNDIQYIVRNIHNL